MSGKPSQAQELVPITLRIEKARDRLVAGAGALVALASLLTWGWSRLNLPMSPPLEPAFDQLLLLSTLVGLAAAALSAFRLRRVAAAFMAGGLSLMATLMVLRTQQSFEIALAAYVGVLLVTIVGNTKTEALFSTGLVVAIALSAYLSAQDVDISLQGVLAVGGLLAATGITLAWLQDSLLSAIGQLEVSQARLHRLSHLDPLTGLGNRRLFDENLSRQLRYITPARPMSLVLIDVDKLKRINDLHGHPIGDKALQLVAEAIRGSIRESDSAARIGGDEFGILLATGGMLGARRVADRIHEFLAAWRLDGREDVDLSVSIGVAEASEPHQSIEELLATADSDMYAGRSNLALPHDPD